MEGCITYEQTMKEKHIGAIIKYFRERAKMRSVELAKASGVNPRTLAAIETGRIKNPSIKNIQTIAKALGVSPADFFRASEAEIPENVHFGSQKGEFSLDMPGRGWRLISFTPTVPEFFIGKVIMSEGARIDNADLKSVAKIFVQVILGKLSANVHTNEYHLKEGNHLMLNGQLPYQFVNHSSKEVSFLLLTTPSFLRAGFQR